MTGAPLCFVLAAVVTLMTAAASQQPRRAAALSRLQIEKTRFVDATRRPFEWRGITAFRLVERLAHGGEKEVVAFLDWAASQTLTVVRVLVMAQHLFQLKPDEGVKVLPRLLELAAARGLYVEVVALADTADIKLDVEQHVKAIGAIAAKHPNALVEIANEPAHPTQDRRLHDPAFVRKLADLIPSQIPVALGSIEANGGYADGRYVTWHSPRSNAQGGWGHVLELRAGAELLARFQKPVVSDEPIGAAEQFIPGRRDNDPKRFAAAAALTRMAGLGATFHYEGGLHARTPTGPELACFAAWKRALEALSDLPDGGEFLSGPLKAAVIPKQGARMSVSRTFDREAWIVGVDPTAGWKPKWSDGWGQDRSIVRDGVAVFRARR